MPASHIMRTAVSNVSIYMVVTCEVWSCSQLLMAAPPSIESEWSSLNKEWEAAIGAANAAKDDNARSIALSIRSARIAKLLDSNPSENWKSLSDSDVSILSEAMLQGGKYDDVLKLCDELEDRDGLSTCLKRKRVQALIYLKRFESASSALRESGLGEASGPLADLHLPLLVMYASRKKWDAAESHGDVAMRYLTWKADNDPEHCAIIRLWVHTYADVAAHASSEARDRQMRRLFDAASDAKAIDKARTLSKAIRLEICLCAALECGSDELVPARSIAEWGAVLAKDSSLPTDQWIWATSRFLRFFELDAATVRDNRDPLADSLLALTSAQQFSGSETDPNLRSVLARCERLRTACQTPSFRNVAPPRDAGTAKPPQE